MKSPVFHALTLGAALLTIPLHAEPYAPPANDRVTLNFNPDWKFVMQDVPGAEVVTFDDAAWKNVSLPHTWTDNKFRDWISTRNDKQTEKIYYGKSWYRKHFTLDPSYAGRKVLLEFQGIGRAGKFFVNGKAIGIHENGVGPCGIDITDAVKFDGDNVIAVQVDNNERYKSVEYKGAELPYGQPFNPNFGGLNRDAVLHITDKVYQTLPLYRNLGTTGTYVYPKDIDTLKKTSTLHVETQIANDDLSPKLVTCEAVVVDRDGNPVLTLPATKPQTIAPGQKAAFAMTAPMTGIHFWSPDFPYLYRVYTITKVDGKVADVYQTPLGVRKMAFDTANGLQINGRRLYLNGYAPRTSMEWPAVGMPPDWMNEYDFKLMKENNANFVRPMHIGPRKVQVEAADKFGIIMVAPAANNEGDEKDPNRWQERLDIMRDVVIAFRNNPSVVFYEACNQILSADHMKQMVDVKTKWDPNGGRYMGTRSNDDKVTQGIREDSNTMDGASFNATTPLWDAEYARGEAPRRVWDNYTPELNPRWDGKDPSRKYITGGYFAIASDYHQKLGLNTNAGDAIGDYLTPLPGGGHPYFRLNNSEDLVLQNLAKYYGRYMRSVFVQSPEVSASKGVMVGGAKIIWSDSVTDGRMRDLEVTRVSGAVDGARLPKEVYYGLQVAQNTKPQVYVVGHWNYPTGTTKRVYVASNTPKTKLEVLDASGKVVKDYGFGSKDFFPEKSFGKAGDQVNNFVVAFDNVAFQPGTIRATGYDDAGKVVATHEKSTAGEPAALKITPLVGPSGQWKADGSDIAMFDVEVVDAKGNRCPTFEDGVTFDCTGEGTFLGGYNSGRRKSTNLDNKTSGYSLNIEAGINRVFTRATRKPGTFTLNVSRPGLKSASATVSSVPIAVTNGIAKEWPQKYEVKLGAEPTPVAEGKAPVTAGAAPVAAATTAPANSLITDLAYSGSHSDVTAVDNAQPNTKVYADQNWTFGKLPAYLQGGTFIRPYQSDAGETSSTDQYQFNLGAPATIYLLVDAANDMPVNNDNASYKWTLMPETVTIHRRPMKIYKSRPMQAKENGYLATNGHGATKFDPKSNMYLVFVVSAK
ncbi:MAG: sugar-binding domain-containing protein [Chthoniobacterales bacterium]